MKMHCLSGGRVRMRKSVYMPDADRSETIELPVSCMLLRHPQGNVLFDTGCHPSVAGESAARWGGMAKFMTPIMPPGDNVLTGLSCVGLSPDDIDVVVCSHLHPDHCGCNAFFKRATVIVHAKEIAAARAPNAERDGLPRGRMGFRHVRCSSSGERDVFGDGRIVLIPLPGHTPGSIGALVALEKSRHVPARRRHREPARDARPRHRAAQHAGPRRRWLKSCEEIRRIEARGATVLCGHDDAQWQTLRKGADVL